MTNSFQSITGKNCGEPLIMTVWLPPDDVLPTVVERSRRRDEELVDEDRELFVSSRLLPCGHTGIGRTMWGIA